jgi:hypothetical protein
MLDATPSTTIFVVAAILQLLTVIGAVITVVRWFKSTENEKIEEITSRNAVDEAQNQKIAVLESRIVALEKANDHVSNQLDKVDFKIDQLNRLLMDFFARGPHK